MGFFSAWKTFLDFGFLGPLGWMGFFSAWKTFLDSCFWSTTPAVAGDGEPTATQASAASVVAHRARPWGSPWRRPASATEGSARALVVAAALATLAPARAVAQGILAALTSLNMLRTKEKSRRVGDQGRRWLRESDPGSVSKNPGTFARPRSPIR